MMNTSGNAQFSVGEHGNLTLNNQSGHVMVRGGDSGTITVQASGSPEDGLPFRHTQDGDYITVDADEDTDLTVAVPRGCVVRVHAADGDVQILGTEAAVRVESSDGHVTVTDAAELCDIRSSDGDVRILGMAGECRVTSTDGHVNVQGIDGSLSVSVDDGDILVTGAHLSSCDLEARDGHINLQTPFLAGERYRIHAHDGDVMLGVAPESDATIYLHSDDGDLRCDLPAQVLRTGKREWIGRIGDGSAQVDVRTSGGHIMVHSTGQSVSSPAPGANWQPIPPILPIPAVSPIPPIPPMEELSPEFAAVDPRGSAPSGHDRTISILAELERGNLSVEEALARLDE